MTNKLKLFQQKKKRKEHITYRTNWDVCQFKPDDFIKISQEIFARKKYIYCAHDFVVIKSINLIPF